jgi:hypothetical protein
MLVTNVLISAILFWSENLSQLIEKVVEDYTLILSTYVVEKSKSVVGRKSPSKMKPLKSF